MEFISIEAERLGFSRTSGILAGTLLHAQFPSSSCRCFSLELTSIECGTCFFGKLPELLSQPSCHIIQYIQGQVCVHAQFGQTVPEREEIEKAKNRGIVRFWKETLEYRNGALQICCQRY